MVDFERRASVRLRLVTILVKETLIDRVNFTRYHPDFARFTDPYKVFSRHKLDQCRANACVLPHGSFGKARHGNGLGQTAHLNLSSFGCSKKNNRKFYEQHYADQDVNPVIVGGKAEASPTTPAAGGKDAAKLDEALVKARALLV